MEDLNRTLFLWLDAPAHPGTASLAIATFLAEWTLWAIPIILAFGWLRGRERTRRVMIEATAAGLAGLLINQVISLVWQHPRPFMIGLGHTHLAHVADSSFPSDHLTLLWSVAFSLLLQSRARRAGTALAVLGLPVAWARIYLGVHFPLDMVGAAAVAIASAGLARRTARHDLLPFWRLAARIRHRAFAPLIERGWVRR